MLKILFVILDLIIGFTTLVAFCLVYGVLGYIFIVAIDTFSMVKTCLGAILVIGFIATCWELGHGLSASAIEKVKLYTNRKVKVDKVK